MNWFHRHRWRVRGAQQLQRTTTSYSGAVTGQCPITEVLLVCDCHTVKTICLDGHWTMEQLVPKTAANSAKDDQAFLRKLGVDL